MTSTRFWIRTAVLLVERYAPDGEVLTGDLLEEHGRGRSSAWVWWRSRFGSISAVADSRSYGGPG